MKRTGVKRYLILILLLLVCAGILWGTMQDSDPPAADAVLVHQIREDCLLS